MAAIRRLAVTAPPATILRSAGRRLSSAVVQAMRDPENEWLDDDARRRRKESEAVMDTDGSVNGRGVQWVTIGEPGADKHVYGYKLSKLLRVPYISLGSLVRQDLSPRSHIYKQISNALNQGRVVPEDVIFGLLCNRLIDGHHRGESGFILDGLPRNRFQAGILDGIADIDLVISFKCTDTFSDNSLITPTSDGYAWNNEKLKQYSAQVMELEDYYKKQKKLLSFQVAGAPTETWQGLISALSLKHMNAAAASSSASSELIS